MDPHQTKIYTAILISSFLIGSIIIYFFISLARHQKRNLELARQNILSEVTTLEKEHARMARDLHDDLGPILTAVKFNITSVEVMAEDQFLIDRASDQLDEAIHRIREIAADLLPATLLRKGLHEALEDFISSLNAPLRIELRFAVQSAIDQERSLHLYRLIKEIIQNTVKHAEAKNLIIQLSESKNTLHLLSEDNGKGFDYDRVLVENTGIGLRNLKSRIELMGGQLAVYTVRGKGTQYTIRIPLQKSESR